MTARIEPSDQAAVETGQEIGAADFKEKQQRQADVVDQSIGLLQEGRVNQADTLEQGAQGNDREDRQDDVESVDKQ